MTDSLYKLVNPEFTFEWNGQSYEVKKASLQKVVLYQERARQLAESKDLSWEIKLTAYCIFLVLKDKIPDLTEEFVLDNTQGNIDFVELMVTLGFVNPTRAEALLRATGKLPTGQASSQESPTGQDGLQEKSAS